MLHLKNPHHVTSSVKNKAKQQNSKAFGFTIVELLIVIVVIGILAAIALVAYNGVTSRAHDATNDSNVTNILKVAEAHNATEGTYPEVIDMWLGSDDYGNSQVVSILNTDVTSVSYDLYRNPAAPDWVSSAMILNTYPISGTDRPFDSWNETVTITIPSVIPGGYASWGEFYDAYNATISSWIAQNPLPPMDAPEHELDQYRLAFISAYPHFECALSMEGCSDPGETIEQREVKKEWMYFIEPLVNPGDASEEVCSNISTNRQKITGLKIKYYNQTRGEWVERVTGGGVSGNVRVCPT